jgi:hypothetical protein
MSRKKETFRLIAVFALCTAGAVAALGVAEAAPRKDLVSSMEVSSNASAKISKSAIAERCWVERHLVGYDYWNNPVNRQVVVCSLEQK